ncbi:ATP-grasp domain-containing protein [Streptomyces poonensis]|uniref:ATP-grasp domain-containing protein n=1 Tax=Streptomyces poonensis TaxID=68255 RepID=A0A918PF27_9ACTN|nr:biotin carboxylase [Streptomyces poonensis]GGZ03522.1 hypothetical protein GCM10010365_22940 [Streptomyces poonensis]GLJ90733.1 hypothetical protein GCM10017589_33380 [Streptomyces poonensis]
MTGLRPHIVILHRWRSRCATYERYLDHHAHAVTYLTTEVGMASVPAQAAELVIVQATDDLARVREELKGLAVRHGPPHAIVALKEDDLVTAAQLAAEWNCGARSPAELRPFRDKYPMVQTVSRAGLAVPATAEAPDPSVIRSFARVHGWPVVLKPRIGSSSEGVVRIDCDEQLAALPFDGEQPQIVQSLNPHPVYHVDGVFDGRDLLCWKSSRYLNTCLEFRGGSPLGSVEEDRPSITEATGQFAVRVLRALTSAPTPFHLELFVDTTNGTGEPLCTFLEVGARVGGAEIPYVWQDVHGYDLMEAAFRIALGERPSSFRPRPATETAGWLLVPAPATRPCVVTGITPMTGRRPGPYSEELLSPGDVLPDAGAYYEHVGGRFRFRGPTSEVVEEAIRITARDFRVTGRACGDAR